MKNSSHNKILGLKSFLVLMDAIKTIAVNFGTQLISHHERRDENFYVIN